MRMLNKRNIVVGIVTFYLAMLSLPHPSTSRGVVVNLLRSVLGDQMLTWNGTHVTSREMTLNQSKIYSFKGPKDTASA